MKCLVGVLLLLLANTASAIYCRVDGGPWQNMTDNRYMDVNVFVRASPVNGRIELDGYQIECKYPPGVGGGPSDRFYLWTSDNSLIPGGGLFGHQTGLRIGGNHLDYPVGPNMTVAQMTGDGGIKVLDTYMYVNTTRVPGKYVDIKAGNRLGIMWFRLDNTLQLPSHLVSFWIYAINDFYFQPSTCTINDNAPIDVDFGPVDALNLDASPGATSVKRVVSLRYSCPDFGINTPITITLKGARSSFWSSVLATSNDDLGVGLLRNGSVVPPESLYTSNIYNSTGGDDVTFALVRRSGSLPAAGPFSGSATLIMGVP